MKPCILFLPLILCACNQPVSKPVNTDDSVQAFMDHGRYTLQTVDTNKSILLLDTARPRAWLLSAGHWTYLAPSITNQTHELPR